MKLSHLPPPAQYFPVRPGPYVMKAGLSRLGTAFGNGAADARVLQLDRDWRRFRDNKLQARAEALDKYYCLAQPLDDGLRGALTGYLLRTLVHEHPAWFSHHEHPDGSCTLACALSGERLHFDDQWQLTDVTTAQPLQPRYRDGVDALACQLQEDLSFVSTAPEDSGRILLLHLCAPNHWAAGERIGRSFQAAHAPVPQFSRIARQTPALLSNLRERGPYVRFAWGLATDARLNHHPEPPAQEPAADVWEGRRFDPERPALFLRVERQVLTGMPEAGGFWFAIRTYLTDVRDLSAEQRGVLAAAVRGMGADIARYKGLADRQQEIADWLESGAQGD